ncbi:tRNA (adenosine(37)-N6)-threonylcarbamoyltransferase complex ATPase subunit type 1 TsaE [Candidatus Saccharibacteria bacterium]|nr:tRNA (adenosine(37)-N6)-threonylcarbamoyltransferase complex ATPase subunit type 1 TsaE [Candidatus Saccharibacteria bacterium]
MQALAQTLAQTIQTQTLESPKSTLSVQETGLVIKLVGPLGAGKTSFLKAFAKALGITKTLISPSFNLNRSYQADQLTLEHWDLYRLSSLDPSLYYTILEQVETAYTIVAIEWLDKFDWIFEKQLTVRFDYPDQLKGQDYQFRNIEIIY